MVIDVGNGYERLGIPSEFIGQTISYAEDVADSAVAVMKEMGIIDEVAHTLPAAVLLELGALSQIRMLEAAMSEDYPSELPSFCDAQRDLLFRLQNSPARFARSDSATLSRQMFRFRMNCLAWSSPIQSPTQFTIANEDSFLDNIAELLWDTRHDHTVEDLQ
jgi:hypothetical protein